MPKLNDRQVKAIEKADPVTTSGFDPHPPGFYLARLKEVEAIKAQSSGAPMWRVVWDNLRDLEGNELPGSAFFNLMMPTSAKRPAGWGEQSNSKKDPDERWTSYQERCKGLIHAFFLAHGFTVDSDTDEMLGEDCVIELGIETAQKGKRAGQQVNTTLGFKAVDEVDGAAEAQTEADDDEDNADEF